MCRGRLGQESTSLPSQQKPACALAWSDLSPTEGAPFSDFLKAVMRVSRNPALPFQVCPCPWQQGGSGNKVPP